MARVVKSLTDTKIKNLKPKEKKYKRNDGKRLYIVVEPNGRKWWMYEYMYNGKRTPKSLGNYPEITLKKARELREKYRKMELENIPPSMLNKSSKQQNTLKNLVIEYLDRKNISDKHKKGTLNRLNNHIFKYIGDMNIRDIKKIDIVNIFRNLTHIPETARRLFNILDNTFKYASTLEIVERNIIADVDFSVLVPKKESKNFPHITDIEEMKKLLKDIENCKCDITVKTALKLAPYLFVRPFPLVAMEWSEIDFEKKEWHIPAHKMKKKREHIVPLTDSIINILKEIEPFTGNREFVFYSPRSKDKHITTDTLNRALKRLGYKDKMTTHGFRHFAATVLNENAKKIGISQNAIAAQLSHTDFKDTMNRVYNKAIYMDERKKLMEWWSDFIDSLKS
ncbi:tyrosine-type recombinase/integrase [Lebetimonas natsushimae]|nr:tyrosine-type recombinase/integrase [Lebetimonas natsushimae]